MPFLSQLGLQKRIMSYVTIGLVVIALGYTYIGLRAIEQSTEMIFQERMTMAQTIAGQVEGLLEHVMEELEGTGDEVALALEADDMQGIEETLRTLYHHWVVFHHFTKPCTISLIDLEGRVMWSEPAGSDVIGTSVVRYPGFQELALSEAPRIVHSPSGIVLKRPVVSVTAPVRGGDGRIIAYLVGEIEPTHASHRLVPNLTVAGEGYAAELVDQNGEVLASTEAERQGKPTTHAQLFADRIQARQADVRIHEPFKGEKGDSHIVAYVPLKHVPWGVFVEQKEDIALRLPHLLRIQLALFGLFALAAGLATAWLTTRSVVGPVNHLIAATQRIAGGDLDHPIAVQAQDEIGQLAAAFERMRQDLAAERRRVQDLAILKERDRLAREMHDGFAQALSVLNLNAKAVRQAIMIGDTVHAGEALDALEQVIDQAYADVREAISGLRTLVPHEQGLIATVSQYLEEFGLQYGIATELDVEGMEEVSFTSTQEIQLLRIIQEALSNVRKHAEADHVWIRFQRIDDDVQITIADDGRGFDPVARVAKQAFGLAIMRERAESLGGSFRLDTRPGAGTTVTVRIPVEREGSERRGAHAHPVGG